MTDLMEAGVGSDRGTKEGTVAEVEYEMQKQTYGDKETAENETAFALKLQQERWQSNQRKRR